ncbi:MAG: VanZ family protein [Luteitalea sp.]|nr:VanZ family protein [Luteitalea sp.]
MACIFAVSSVSDIPRLPEGADKNLHALVYFGLGVLLTRAMSQGDPARASLRTALLATAVAALYGVSDELHQSFVPLREVDALDVLADTLGAGAAAFGLYAWGIIQSRHAL